MKYRSTRGDTALLSFEECVLQGLAPDGGLYLPENIPQFSLDEILSWRDMSFVNIGFSVFRPFVGRGDIPDDDLRSILQKSFSTFSTESVAKLIKLARGYV